MGWARGYPLYLPPPPRPKHYAPHMGICLGRTGGGRRSRAFDDGGAVAERARWGSVGTFPRARPPRPAPPACAPPCPTPALPRQRARAPHAPHSPRSPARARPVPPRPRASARARPAPPASPARAPRPAPRAAACTPAPAPHPSPINCESTCGVVGLL